MESSEKRVWAEISLANIVKNHEYIRSLVGEGCTVCAVVKANAYGHGSLPVARALEDAGVKFFAAATVGEAAELREGGINSDILVLGRTEPEDCELLAQKDIIQAVYSYDYAGELADALKAKGLTARIHVKLDTGMNRIGFPCRSADDIQATAARIVNLSRMPVFKLEGIYSHFAVSDRRADIFNAIQFRNFLTVSNKLKKLGVEPLVRHICNSDAIANFPYCHMDMVRAGISLYGAEGGPKLSAAMSVKCKIIYVHTVRSGESISYGCDYKAPRDVEVATLSIGYADGLPRAWAEKGYVIINGKRAKILGRICMDQCMVDVSEIDCAVGDTATVFGTDGLETLPAKKLAETIGTISYEILCNFDRPRVEKVYVD